MRSVVVFLLFIAATSRCAAQDSIKVISGDSALTIAANSGGKFYKHRFGWRAVEFLDTTGTIWTVYSYKSRSKLIRKGRSCVSKRWTRTIVIDGRTGQIISHDKKKYIDTNCPPNF